MNNLYKEMKGLYSLDKTLCFELKPVGETLNNIIENNILEKDEHRSVVYENVKRYCDEYHKYFIDLCLQHVQLTNLKDYIL